MAFDDCVVLALVTCLLHWKWHDVCVMKDRLGFWLVALNNSTWSNKEGIG
jgi:hypothetical protein